MPLPFLKPKHAAGVIISHRKPDGDKPQEQEEGGGHEGLMACAEALIRAIHAKDAQSVASALREAMEVMEMEAPQESEDYDSMNELAAKEQE